MAAYDPADLTRIVDQLSGTMQRIEDMFAQFFISIADVDAALDLFSEKLLNTGNQFNLDNLQTGFDLFADRIVGLAAGLTMPGGGGADLDGFNNRIEALNNSISIMVGSIVDASNAMTDASKKTGGGVGGGGGAKLSIPKTVKELDAFIKKVNETFTPFTTIKKSTFEFANSLRTASNSVENSGTTFGKLGDKFGALIQKFAGPIAGAIVAFKGLQTGVKAINAVFKGFTTVLSSSFSALQSIPAMISKFVEAFNPQLVEAFGMVVSDLMAVIGAGLQPVLEGLMILFRAVADSLVPIIEKLAPAFQQVAQGIVKFFIPIFSALFNIFNQLIPIINELAPVFVKIAETAGQIIMVLLDGLAPTIQFLAGFLLQLANVVATVLQAVLGWLESFPYLEEVMAAMATVVIAGVIPALAAFIAELILAAGPFVLLTAAVTGIIVAFKKLFSWFQSNDEAEKKRKEKEEKDARKRDFFASTGASVGATARKAEFTSVENLSRNLIKSAFQGTGNDRLRSIDNKMGELVNINKEQLALGKGQAPKLAGVNPNEKVPGQN